MSRTRTQGKWAKVLPPNPVWQPQHEFAHRCIGYFAVSKTSVVGDFIQDWSPRRDHLEIKSGNSSSGSLGLNKFGRTFDYAVGEQIHLEGSQAIWPKDADITILFIGAPDINDADLVSADTGGSAALFTLWVSSTPTIEFSLVGTDGSGNINISRTVDVLDVIVATYKADPNPVVSGVMKIFVNGVELASGGTTKGPIALGTEVLRLLGNVDSVGRGGGKFTAAAVWNYAMPPAKVGRLSANPFGVIRPSKLISAAAAAATVSDFRYPVRMVMG